jgi:hypothetical protein
MKKNPASRFEFSADAKETMKTHTCMDKKDERCEGCSCTPEGILSTCYHEAGHAVAGYHFGITILDVDGHSMTITNNEVVSEVHLDNYDLKHPLLARISTRYAGVIAQDMHARRCGSGEDVYGSDWVNSDDAERIAEALRLSTDALSAIDVDGFLAALGWSSQFIASEVLKVGNVELDKVKEDLQSSGHKEFFNPRPGGPHNETEERRKKELAQPDSQQHEHRVRCPISPVHLCQLCLVRKDLGCACENP